ncbi:MAG: CAP domain-containing protein [Saprospiraceae bacterium]
MKKTTLLLLFLLSGILTINAQKNCTNSCDDIALKKFQNESLQLINEYRRANGKKALVKDPYLKKAAQDYVDWCVKNERLYNYNSHRADGTTPEQRISSAIVEGNGPYDFKGTGENLTRGYKCAKDCFNSWKGSPPHNSQMLNTNHEYIGFGIACHNGTFIAAQVFGNQKFKKPSHEFRFNDDFSYNLNTHTFSFSYEASKDFAKSNQQIWPFFETQIFDDYGDVWNYGGSVSYPIDIGMNKITKVVEINRSYPDKRVKSGYKMRITYYDGSRYQEKWYDIGESIDFVDINSPDFVTEFSVDKSKNQATIKTNRQNQRRYGVQFDIRLKKKDGTYMGNKAGTIKDQVEVVNFGWNTNDFDIFIFELLIDNKVVKVYNAQ